MANKRKNPWWLNSIFAALAGLGGFASFVLLRNFVVWILETYFNIVNENLTYSIILIFVILLLLVAGWTRKKITGRVFWG